MALCTINLQPETLKERTFGDECTAPVTEDVKRVKRVISANKQHHCTLNISQQHSHYSCWLTAVRHCSVMVKGILRPGVGRTHRCLFLLVVVSGLFLLSPKRSEYQQQTGSRHLLWHIPELGPPNCTPPAIQEFPRDLFTPEQLSSGAVILHVIACCYMFVLLAIVCDDYFVPCIQKMCKNLSLSEDVVGATFMAAAVSSPELFINVIGTFITEGDIGVGTVVGSAVFNILAVPACCGLFSEKTATLSWWSVSRDCAVYACTVLLLIVTLWDGQVYWYEALVLVLLYSFYILAMYFNSKIGGWVQKKVRCYRRQGYKQIPGNTLSLESNSVVSHTEKSNLKESTATRNGSVITEQRRIMILEDEESDTEIEICACTSEDNRLWKIIVFPVTLILALTIPNCRSGCWKRFYLLTFTMCIIWIGVTSYLVAWMITVIGNTLQIPDSVMGLTFLAAGMSVPEAVSSVIVTNQGHGSMGISNSIASNTFDILLCLGLPWLIKASFLPAVEGQNFVQINSGGLGYSAISLLSTLFLLYATFAFNDFKLDCKVGAICLLIYITFLVLATLVELNIFFPVNLPICGIS